MESATISTPLALAKEVLCYPLEPNNPERPEYQNFIDIRGKVLPTP